MTRTLPLFAAAIALAGQPCMPKGDLEPIGDTGDSLPDDTAAGDTGDSQGMGPCESGICDVTVTDALVECGSDTTAAPEPLEITASGPGTLSVWHHHVQWGCCPQLDVQAVQDLRHGTIEVVYDLYDDMCDCICELDVRYTLTELQSGAFTLQAEGATLKVEVP
jgi:hypothetical protein